MCLFMWISLRFGLLIWHKIHLNMSPWACWQTACCVFSPSCQSLCCWLIFHFILSQLGEERRNKLQQERDKKREKQLALLSTHENQLCPSCVVKTERKQRKHKIFTEDNKQISLKARATKSSLCVLAQWQRPFSFSLFLTLNRRVCLLPLVELKENNVTWFPFSLCVCLSEDS